MRSPLTEKPLRTPGQSLEERMKQRVMDGVAYYVVAATCVCFAVFEWLKYANSWPLTPTLYSIIALIAVVIAVIKIYPMFADLKNYRQGRDGEKAVAEELDKLREKGIKVYHDICADNFNIDHVVVSTGGVFVIETKAWSKKDQGKPTIEYNDKALLKYGEPVGSQPMEQADMNARFIQSELKRSTGKQFNVQPILTFPGWFVTPYTKVALKPWLLNHKWIPGEIEKSKAVLSKEDVKLIEYHLERIIRTFEPT